MKTKITITFFLIFIACAVSFGQEREMVQQAPLSQSVRSSEYTHVYRLSNEQLSKLIECDFDDLDESYLTDFVVAIPNYGQGQETMPLPPGTYVYVYAREGNILYSVRQKMTVEPVIAMPNGKFEMLLKDVETGNIVTDAQVYMGKKQLKFDSKTLLYKGDLKIEKTPFRIRYKGVDNYYSVEKEDAQNNVSSHNKKQKKSLKFYFKRYIGYPVKRLFEDKEDKEERAYQQRRGFTGNHTGYMVFDKPKYRPDDTVNIKAWITDKKGRPVKDKEMLVRIDDEDEPLGIAKAYRKGGFTFSFQLVDSLDLSLDSDYDISFERLPKSPKALEEANDDDDLRMVFMRKSFIYEDYELMDVNFFARCNPKFHRGDSIELFLQAKDENDLTVPDGRVKILVTISSVNRVINERDFIPDFLWSTDNYRLDAEGETKVTIPAHLFPKANVDCSVKIEFLNTDNQWDSKRLNFKYVYQNEYIKAAVEYSDLVFSYFMDGLESSTDALLKIEKKTGTENKNIRLPYQTPLDARVISYSIETNALNESFENEDYFPSPGVTFSRTADSLFLSIKNEKQLPYWYTLFVNGKEQESGNGNTSSQLNKKLKTDKQAVLKFNYEFAGKLKSALYTIDAPGNKLLDVTVDAPRFVSPGQTFDVEATVTDMHTKPQANVDLTAFAPTSKFKERRHFVVPYFGKEVKSEPVKTTVYDFDEKSSSGYFSDSSRWVTELNLNENEYYKFLNTPDIYMNTEAIAADKAEIAPFVVKNGKILPVHILYINDLPVFFSKATQLNRYSFSVMTGLSCKIRMRTSECEVTLDTVMPVEGKKLILSVNADSAGYFTTHRITFAQNYLSGREMDYMSNYMLSVENTFYKNYAWIEDRGKIWLLNPKHESGPGTILAGPLIRNKSLNFNLYNMFSMNFPFASNYTFGFERDILRQTYIAEKYPFTSALNYDVNVNLSDTVFDEKELENWYENMMDLLMYNDAGNVDSYGYTHIRLRIEALGGDIPKGQIINSVIIYQYEKSSTYCVSGGRTLSYYDLPFEGKCRIVFLLKNKQFFSLENVELKKSGLNYVRTGEIVPRPIERDSIASKFYYDIRRKHRLDIESQFKSSNIKTEPLLMVYDPATFNHGVSGKVTNESGMPLTGVRVVVKGINAATSVGTVTDVKGNFQIKVPLNAILVFDYIGFNSVEKKVEAQSGYNESSSAHTIINVMMENRISNLEEVLVLGYTTQKKQQLAGAVSTVSSSDLFYVTPGKNEGIMIRGTGGTAGEKPLIIVDGIPYSGNLDDLNPEDIVQLNVLKDDAATAIYGAGGANGVIIITTNKLLKANEAENAEDSDAFNEASISLRKNFKDVAFWQPMLKTDKNGKARFTVTMPDDISRWNAHFIAMGGKAKTGYMTMDIKSFKSLTATLALPRFAITDDSIYAIGKISNYMGVEQELQRQITINGEKGFPEKFTVMNFKADTIAMHAASDVDTMNIIYSFVQQNGYSDGEERLLPVFPQGTKETEGNFYVLEGDSGFVFHPKPDGSEVTFRTEGSPLPDMLNEIDHIRNYEYLCNEQLASKLKALLMEKRIRSYLNVPFDGEENILYIMGKITETRLSNGYWGWWPGSDIQIWISRHVIEALYMARQDGYRVDFDFQASIDDIMLRFPAQSVRDRINSLQLLIMLDARPDYEKLIADTEEKMAVEMQTTVRTLSNQALLFELMHIKQQKGISIDTEELLKTKRKNMFGAVYWGQENSYSLFYNSTRETLLAYRILKADTINNHENTLKGIRHYFFHQRKDGNWRNIYEGSSILETILPDLLKESGGELKATTVKYSAAKDSIITEFPVSLNSAPDQPLTIEKEGTAPVYVTTYQQYWNKQPERVEKEFIVNTYFENKGQKIDSVLAAGQPVTLVAEVTASADAEYVMIEIPIPAGCSYFDDSRSTYNRYRTETHREQFKHKTAIFCERMREGKHTFRIELMPRFTGKYTLNPAKAEMMYFPVFYGRENIKQIEIR